MFGFLFCNSSTKYPYTLSLWPSLGDSVPVLWSWSSLALDSGFLRRIFIKFILSKSLSKQAKLKLNIFNMYNKKNRFGYSCLSDCQWRMTPRITFLRTLWVLFYICYSCFTLVSWRQDSCDLRFLNRSSDK